MMRKTLFGVLGMRLSDHDLDAVEGLILETRDSMLEVGEDCRHGTLYTSLFESE